MDTKFLLKFLWFKDKSIAIGLDRKVLEKSIPVTEFFFWPRSDAWEEMRLSLESKDWISASDIVLVLNQLTEVINFWQEKNTLYTSVNFSVVKNKFPNCEFIYFE